jgi:xanthine dehydrogenase accessory factor
VAALERAGVRVIPAEHDDPEVLEGFGDPADGAALVVMTHDHQLDQRVVEWGFARGFAFVGGVGSRAKAERTRQRLEAKGLPPALVASLRMPVGVDVGARRPAEIAVSIAAELVAHRARLEGLARHVDADAAPSGADEGRGTPPPVGGAEPGPPSTSAKVPSDADAEDLPS